MIIKRNHNKIKKIKEYEISSGRTCLARDLRGER